MRSSRFLPGLFALLCGSIGCSGSNTNEYVPPPEAYHSPHSISDILKSNRPQDFYTEAYGAFRFSSQSVLSFTKNDQNRTFQGSSALEMDDKGNYRLVRIPLSGEPAVELVQFGQKVYLKSGEEAGYRVMRAHYEFSRWLTVSLQEIFSLYAQTDLAAGEPSTTKGAASCWAKGKNVLCVDPVTSLPVEGTLTVPQPSGSVLSVRFNFAPAKAGSLQISPPS